MQEEEKSRFCTNVMLFPFKMSRNRVVNRNMGSNEFKLVTAIKCHLKSCFPTFFRKQLELFDAKFHLSPVHLDLENDLILPL